MSEPLCSSARFHYFPPLEENDNVCYELYCDERVMLPFIPQLYKMDPVAFQERRNEHRLKFLKQSCFLDIISRGTGEFVGTCGFREFRMLEIGCENENYSSRQKAIDANNENLRMGEFGVNICYQYQRKGICTEAFIQMLRLAKNRLNCTEIEGVTMSGNTPMRNFFEKFELPIVKTVFIDKSGCRHETRVYENDVEHTVYQSSISKILSKHDI